MRTEVIKADTIDAAVERILSELGKDTRRSSNRESAIYFDGWNGLGASAVLKVVARRLEVYRVLSIGPEGLQFDEIIHIDCSKWESRRTMQRKIAEQLKLSDWVMEMFDKQDEEDDFNGLDQGSRSEIEQVFTEIYRSVRNRRFLLVLHNGSNDEIDIFKFGLYLYGYANSKMLWTFRGRFRLDPKMIDNVKNNTITHVLLSASRDVRDPRDLWSYLVCDEAEQVSWTKPGYYFIDPTIAADCVLYMLKQSWIGSRINDCDWAIHTSNYWICDGIIEVTNIDNAWQVGDALQGEMPLFNICTQLNNDESAVSASHHLARSAEHTPYWISTTTSSSSFVVSPSGVIPENMFQHSQRLGLLKLSRCTFSFSSPPFLCCRSLRFLWLDRCEDLLARSTTSHHPTDANKEAKGMENSTTTSWECFQSLWVLDLRYTNCDHILSARVMDLMTQLRVLNVMGAKNWDMSHLRGRLPNIRKLRVTMSTCYFNNNMFSEMGNIELLDFLGNTIRRGMTSLSGPASNSSLKTVTIDGCNGLEVISFRGCKELENLFLKGSLGSLEELDLSGTKVKTLDLGGVESTLPVRIILLGCERLRAILWPKSVINKEKELYVLLIDTTSTSASTDGGESTHAHPHGDQSLQQQKEKLFKDGWQISLKDARLLRSLSAVRSYFIGGSVHIDICSPAILGGSNVQATSSDKLVQVQQHTSTIMDSEYRDVAKDGPAEVMTMQECPGINHRWRGSPRTSCMVRMIMRGQGNKLLVEDAPSATSSSALLFKFLVEDAPSATSSTALLFPDFICESATSLHVYDNSSVTSIPAPPKGLGWLRLQWCRVERCPKLHTVFTIPMGSDVESFYFLGTFWASQLLSPCYIWDRPINNTAPHLLFLHLDHCPRLVHVLPLCRRNISGYSIDSVLPSLEILEIVYCSDLKEVFHLDLELHAQDKVIEFPNLRCIHLHELPTLQRICGRRMRAPNLETIKIRGCWSLKRLPAVWRNTKPPKVDCEKEWWDNLEWDGLEEHHHPSLYESSHSLYYKAQLPRASLLR